MLFQASVPRPNIDLNKHPKYVHVHTMTVPGISTGELNFSGTTDAEHGKHATTLLEPAQTYSLPGDRAIMEYILPFWLLFNKPEHNKLQGSSLSLGGGARQTLTTRRSEQNEDVNAEFRAQQGVVVARGGVQLARLISGGFAINLRSAYRASPQEYEEHNLSFRIEAPVTGGGVLRLGDSRYDIANPTLDFYAPSPFVRPDLETQGAYERAHALPRAGASDLRAQRIAQAEASMRNEAAANVIDEELAQLDGPKR